MFVYLNYENESNNWVYFNDFNVTHTKSRIVQYNEYYPFGMATQNRWTREGATGNNLPGIGGTEWNATSSFYDLDYRNYDPILGTMNLKPAVYAGGLEAENQIAMGLTVAINISLGILKKDYLGALSMRNNLTQGESLPVLQAGLSGVDINVMEGYFIAWEGGMFKEEQRIEKLLKSNASKGQRHFLKNGLKNVRALGAAAGAIGVGFVVV